MFPWILCGILLLLSIYLFCRLLILHRSLDALCSQLPCRLSGETNALLDLSSRDSHLRKLAVMLNTELKALRGARHRYQQGDLELKEAVTNISHDLRTPLTTISGYLELLQQEAVNDTAKRYLTRIESRTDAMKELTEELFCYSIATASRKQHPVRLDLVRVLEESLLSFYAEMQKRQIQPQLNLPEIPVWRILDEAAVSRIFSNLISNAMKYTDNGLTVSMTRDGTILFSNPAKKLDQVAVGRLFDRFYTVEAGRSATGLGLSIAKTLTEQMGGTIHAAYRDGILSVTVCFLQNDTG